MAYPFIFVEATLSFYQEGFLCCEYALLRASLFGVFSTFIVQLYAEFWGLHLLITSVNDLAHQLVPKESVTSLEHYLQIQLSSYAEKTMVAIHEFYSIHVQSQRISLILSEMGNLHLSLSYSKEGIGQVIFVLTIKIISYHW